MTDREIIKSLYRQLHLLADDNEKLWEANKAAAANDVKDDYKRLLYQYGDHLPGCAWREARKPGQDEAEKCNCGWYTLRFNVKQALNRDATAEEV
jgi:hypothetical protein